MLHPKKHKTRNLAKVRQRNEYRNKRIPIIKKFDLLIRVDRWLHNHPLPRICGVIAATIGFFVIVLTAYQISIDLDERAEERIAREEQRIARAWENLLRRAAGNTGKAQALNSISSKNASLTGIDLSCSSRGELENSNCLRPPIYEGISLPDGAEWQDISFANTRINGLKGFNARINRINLQASRIENINLENTDIETKGKRFYCKNCSFINSNIDENTLFSIVSGHVSGSIIYVYEKSSLERYMRGQYFESLDAEHEIFAGNPAQKSTLAIEARLRNIAAPPERIKTDASNLPHVFIMTHHNDHVRWCYFTKFYKEVLYYCNLSGSEECLDFEDAEKIDSQLLNKLDGLVKDRSRRFINLNLCPKV